MRNSMAVSVAVVLLIGASAFAQLFDVTNNQQLLFSGHTLSGNLDVTGVGGTGVLTTNPPLILAMDNIGSANSGQTLANQHITGILDMDGTVNTQGAANVELALSVDAQTVGITGFIPAGQIQTMEGDGDAKQTQGFQLAAGQDLSKAGVGTANGTGTNAITNMSLVQNVAGSGTTSGTQSVLINGLQTTSLVCGASGTGTISADLSVITAQSQEISQ